jgi:hypothetical protein
MADEDHTFETNTTAANRAQTQGLGAGQREMNAQRSPAREQHATDPGRLEPFDQSLDPTTNADRPEEADFSGQDVSAGGEPRSFQQEASPLDDRNAAGLKEAGDLGAGVPAGVDIHDVGQEDRPEQAWGDETLGDDDPMHSANHTRRPIKTEAERGQGAKTRKMTKDIISRRT